MELSFVGNKNGLRHYIESFLPNCEKCEDKGYIEKTEWSDEDGRDLDYEIKVRCTCQED